MKRAPDTEDLRLWSIVAQTVRPFAGREAPAPPKPAPTARKSIPAAPSPPRPRVAQPPRPPERVEPGLHRRIVRGREAVAARIDLHGLTYDDARAALGDFILRAVSQGWRAVLVITGKGALGDGVLRRHTPEWLAQPPLREHIAGISEAHRRHGGEGALYVALRRPR
jgi:DNA-nicking Smr family endonuclease